MKKLMFEALKQRKELIETNPHLTIELYNPALLGRRLKCSRSGKLKSPFDKALYF